MLVLGGLLTATGGAQDRSQQFVGEATVNVIEVPVRVVDPDTGEPVTGLGPEAFRILEDGTEQPISNFSEISSKVVVQADDVAEAVPGDAAPAGEISKPVELIYFFDLYLMYKSDKERAIEGLRRLYSQGLPDGESVSLVAFDGDLETLVDRSADRQEVLVGLDDIRTIAARGINQRITLTQALSDAPVTGERDAGYYERRQRNLEYTADLERKSARVGNALLATMARYATADGRRVLVAFTPAYPKSDWSPTYYSVDYLNAAVEYPQRDLWRRVALEASDLGFTLYAVDSFGLSSPLASDANIGITDSVAEFQRESFGTVGDPGRGVPGSVADPSGPAEESSTRGFAEEVDNMGQWLERSRKNLLIDTATATGGEAVFSADVAAAVTGIRSNVDHYYSIGYTADHIGDGSTYEIEVRLPDHPRFRVVHRTAYVDLPASARAAQALRSEMLFGGDANPLGVRVEVGEPDSRLRIGASGSKRVRIPVKVMIPFARLTMIPRGDIHWGKVLITFFGEDAQGNQSELASVEQPITVESGRYEEAVATGYFTYNATVQVEGGRQEVFVGIQDTLGGRTSIVPKTFQF
jgi:VWFA-related protein